MWACACCERDARLELHAKGVRSGQTTKRQSPSYAGPSMKVVTEAEARRRQQAHQQSARSATPSSCVKRAQSRFGLRRASATQRLVPQPLPLPCDRAHGPGSRPVLVARRALDLHHVRGLRQRRLHGHRAAQPGQQPRRAAQRGGRDVSSRRTAFDGADPPGQRGREVDRVRCSDARCAPGQNVLDAAPHARERVSECVRA
jgi:hypothetical protein